MITESYRTELTDKEWRRKDNIDTILSIVLIPICAIFWLFSDKTKPLTTKRRKINITRGHP